MRVLGLTGKKYAGKDTAALALIEDGWVRLAFADALREMLYVLNPIVSVASPTGDPADTEVTTWQQAIDTMGYDEMKKWPEARRLMQVFATEVIRDMVSPDLWVDIARRKVHQHRVASSPPPGVVLTDVRFDNEARMVRDLGGDIIRIVYTGPITRDTHGEDHVSERGVSDGLIDLTIYNGNTVEQLHENIRSVAAALRQ